MDNNRDKNEVFSKRMKAGKRTYFFDVKATRGNDYYLTITESKKRYDDAGGFTYEKHKIFLYKEDFEAFIESLRETVDHVKTELLPDYDFSQLDSQEEPSLDSKEEAAGEDKDYKWE